MACLLISVGRGTSIGSYEGVLEAIVLRSPEILPAHACPPYLKASTVSLSHPGSSYCCYCYLLVLVKPRDDLKSLEEHRCQLERIPASRNLFDTPRRYEIYFLFFSGYPVVHQMIIPALH